MNRFIFRNIKQNETDQANTIEQICFPPHEACSEKSMVERIRAAEELFLVAVDEKTGKIAGFLNGIATDESSFRDEFFTDAGCMTHREKISCFLVWMCCRNTKDRDLAGNW